MTPAEFKEWRKLLGLNQDEAATALGVSRASVQLYERGQRHDDGRRVEIPQSIALACDAIALRLAAERGDASLLNDPLRRVVATVAALIGKASA